jgi:hypothetical protein
MSFSSPRPMVNRVSRGNIIPFVTRSSAIGYDWMISAKSPCLLNRNNQYSDGFISSTGFIYRTLSSAEGLARIFHELLSRDHEDGRATWQPQGVGSEAYLNCTSQEPTPEDVMKHGHIRGRSK